mmetsp:Transcript_20060/g.39413  ORF Transcript_20060/g.39413 Transcript_20060/m.39413 type:complete len:300 (+) Transcript_20060:107-1006(+)
MSDGRSYSRGGGDDYYSRGRSSYRSHGGRDDYSRSSRDNYSDRRSETRGHQSRQGGARGLARIHGTEQDRVNCTFYIKMGVCRHGDKCERQHNKPAFSQTIMIPGMYPNPEAVNMAARKDGSFVPKQRPGDRDAAFEEFFVDMFEEVSKCGEIEDVVVCDNLCDHMMGNVYIKFYDEIDADKCLKLVSGRYYQGKKLDAEFVPVTDFSLSRCRQYDRRECDRGGTCSYMHVKRLDPGLENDLLNEQPYKGHRSANIRNRSPSRSRSPSDRHRSRSYGRSRDHRRSRSPSSRYRHRDSRR